MHPCTALHTHSWYSLLEGASAPAALLARARACGYTSLALTDTNNLYGAVPFVEAAQRQDIRPLLGTCLRQHRTRCVALIAEPAGWASLCRVLTRLHLFTHVRLADLLSANAEGLHLLVDDLVLAEPLRDAFPQRLWLEIVRPGPGQRTRQVNAQRERELLEGGRRLGLRPVASTAAHFATAEDYPVFRVATAVRQGGLLDQLPQILSITPEHHLVDGPTWQQRFADLPEALTNLAQLAEQLSSEALPKRTILPPAKVPRRCTAHQFLRALCERGMHRRGLHGNLAAHERLGEELVIIEATGLAPYFLVVRDIARRARNRQLPMALRGSAGNSLVCYLLEITDVDPLRFGLALDRFLHVGRPDLPDIDLDFDWRVRDQIIDHVFTRYGPEHTAMVSSHLFLQPRSAFREAGKIHGLSNEQITLLTQTLSDDEADVPAHFPLEAARWPWVQRDAELLLGRPHHLSVHPGGIIITPDPLDNHVPLQRAAKGVLITHFDKDGVEATGLVKIDLLGNRALANVAETLHLLTAASVHPGVAGAEQRDAPVITAVPPMHPGVAGAERCDAPVGSCRGITLFCPGHTSKGRSSVSEWLYDDSATLQLLRAGDTLGVNQLESPAMRHLLVQLKPRALSDIVCALALIRPGAGAIGMKGRYIERHCGGAPVPKMPTPLEPVLRETYGLLVYQDDAFGMIRALTGLSTPETHRFYKRATQRVSEEEDRALAAEFRQLCLARGIPEAVIAEQWRLLTHFRRYTFCKSHAVSYGLIAWRCAYAKVHEPLGFWAAVLNNNQGVYPRRVYVEALKRAGYRILLPCVNHSEDRFIADCRLQIADWKKENCQDSPAFNPQSAICNLQSAGAVRTGLGAIATLPEEVKEAILAERRRQGPYRDLADFRHRVAPPPEALATLIQAGALDFTGRPRPGLFLDADLQDRAGADELFDEGDGPDWLPSDYALDRRRLDEWWLLGFVADRPLMSLFRPGLPDNLVRSIDLPRHKGQRIRTAAVVATGRFANTERGTEMQFITLEDEWGLMEVTLFPGTCPLVNFLTLGPYLVTGRVEEQFGVFTITAESFTPLSSTTSKALTRLV